MYWQPESECMDREELAQLQLERLESTLNRVYLNVPFYRKKFDEIGFNPDDLRSLDDLRKLPFTTKNDLRENYPYGLFAVPLREVVRVHASSGTTGMSTVVGYSRNDIKTWSNLVARILAAGGITKDDVIQISFNYGLFTGAFGLHYGAERLGASVIPISSGNTRRQIQIMQDFKTTALVGTPSYAMLIADTMMEMGINRNSLSLKYGLFGAEPWSDAMRKELESKLKIVATDNYGLSEVMGPGVAGECLERNGLHIAEDHFLVEVINPDTLAAGQARRSGRAGDHDADEGGLPGDPVPHPRPDAADPGAVRLRQDHAQDDPRLRQDRRHADHPRRERLPAADRDRAVRDRRRGAALPDHHRPQGRAGRDHGQRRGIGVDLLRRDEEAVRAEGDHQEAACLGARHLGGSEARGEEDAGAVRRKSEASDR